MKSDYISLRLLDGYCNLQTRNAFRSVAADGRPSFLLAGKSECWAPNRFANVAAVRALQSGPFDDQTTCLELIFGHSVLTRAYEIRSRYRPHALTPDGARFLEKTVDETSWRSDGAVGGWVKNSITPWLCKHLCGYALRPGTAQQRCAYEAVSRT